MQNNLALNDEELIRHARMGREDAFTELYKRYLPSVYARVRFKVPEEEAEDITQEIFIAAMKSLHRFQGQSKFSTWLWTLTNRKIADYYRSSKYFIARNSEQEEAVERGSIASSRSASSYQEDLLAVQNALCKLPENYQEILLLRFIDEIPFSEIARLKGQSLEATKSLFRRSVAALRKELVRNEV
jgi:RNA polymerase sigma-70 factor, ECF subfamily